MNHRLQMMGFAALYLAGRTHPATGRHARGTLRPEAKRVEVGLEVFMEILPNPDFRTFNSIQPKLATSTLDYNSMGRTLLFKGATHLIGIPSGPTNTDVRLTETQLDRKERLQRTIFSFPKQPADGVERLKMSDFDAMFDPLDDSDVYESFGPQLP